MVFFLFKFDSVGFIIFMFLFEGDEDVLECFRNKGLDVGVLFDDKVESWELVWI